MPLSIYRLMQVNMFLRVLLTVMYVHILKIHVSFDLFTPNQSKNIRIERQFMMCCVNVLRLQRHICTFVGFVFCNAGTHKTCKQYIIDVDVIESLGADQLSLRIIAIKLNFVKDHKFS